VVDGKRRHDGGLGRLIATALVLQRGSRLWASTRATYIDAGSGSFIFQAVIGGLLAVAVMFRVFWRKLLGVFKRDDRQPQS
jgi:hypothetical protein